jgi:hypothetical protein
MVSRTFCDKCGVQAEVETYHFGPEPGFGPRYERRFVPDLCKGCADSVMEVVGTWMGGKVEGFGPGPAFRRQAR